MYLFACLSIDKHWESNPETGTWYITELYLHNKTAQFQLYVQINDSNYVVEK